MATSAKPAAGAASSNPKGSTLPSDRDEQNTTPTTATEKESDEFLDAQTNGQVYDENDSGQLGSDQMDDSSRADNQAPIGRAPASADNLPDQLTHPSEAAYTLPELHHQGKRLSAEGDDSKK